MGGADVGQRRRRVLRAWVCTRGASMPARSRVFGWPRSDRVPPARSPGSASAPISFPNASSPRRSSTRSPRRLHPGRACCSPAPNRRATCFPTAWPPRATASTSFPCTAPWPPSPTPSDLERVRTGDFDVVTFTSSSTVENFCRLVGPIEGVYSVVSIGPVTSATAGRGRVAGRRGGRSARHRRPRRRRSRAARPVA